MGQASVTIDLQARITGYEQSLAKLKADASKIDIGSKIGKELSTAIETADNKLKALKRNMTPTASNEGQVDAIVEKYNLAGEAIQRVAGLMGKVTVGDLNLSASSAGVDNFIKKIQELESELSGKINSGVQSAISSNDKLKESFNNVFSPDEVKGKDISQIFDMLSEKSKTAQASLAATEAELKKVNDSIARNQATQDRLTNGPLGTQQSKDELINQAKQLQTEYDAIFSELKEKVSKNLSTALAGRDDINSQKLIDNFFNGLNPSNIKERMNSLYDELKSAGIASGKMDFWKAIFGEEGNINQVIKKIGLEDPQPIITKIQELYNSIQQVFSGKEVNILEGLFNKESIDAYIDKLVNYLQNDAANRVQSKIQNVKKTGTELNERKAQLETTQTNTSTQVSNINDLVTKLEQEIQIRTKENQDLINEINALKAQINSKQQEKVNAIHENAKQSKIDVSQWKIGADAVHQYKTAVDQARSAEKFIGKLEGVVQRWFSIYAVVRMVTNAVKSVISTVKELDKTITEIAIVTNMTQDQLWDQMSSYTAMARKYASSISGVYKVSQLYYQQGLQTADVMALTEQTLKMARISGLEYATATDYMTNAVRSFKMEMTDAQRVVDVYSAIAASSATSTAELASAMSKTASSAQSVGSSFENTTAMMAVMIESTRESAENIGSALKSIISRYGEMKTDPSKLVDSEGEEMSLNKVDKALQSVGISIKDANNQFRDFDEVIFELSEKWDTIDKNTQRYIATIMAGNRQQSRFLALVSNGERLAELSEEAANSEDAATLQVLKTMDSIEAKTQQFKTSLQSLYTDAGIEDLYKSLLDFGNNIVQTFTNVAKAMGTPLAAVAKFGVQFASLAHIITTVFGVIKFKLTTQIKSLTNEEMVESQKRIAILTDEELEREILANKAALAAMKTEQEITSNTAQNIKTRLQMLEAEQQARANGGHATVAGVRGGIDAKTAKWGVAASLAGSAMSMAAANIDEKTQPNRNLKAGLTFGGSVAQGVGLGSMFGTKGMAAGAAIGAIVGIVESLGIIVETTEEKIQNLGNAIEETSNKKLQSKDELKTLTDYKKKYDELAKIRFKDAESKEEWIKLNNEIAASYPELIKSMDAEGNYIVNMTSAYESLADAKARTYKQDFIKNLNAELNGLTDLDYILTKYYGTSVLEGPDSYWSLSFANTPNLKIIGKKYQEYLNTRTQGQAFEYNSHDYTHAAATYSTIFGVSSKDLKGSSSNKVLAKDAVRYDEIISLMAGYAEQRLSRFEAAQKLLNEHEEFIDLSPYIYNFNETLFNYFKTAASGISYEDELIQQAYKRNTQEWINVLGELTGVKANNIQFDALTHSAQKLWEDYLAAYKKNGSHKIGDMVEREDGTTSEWTETDIFEEFLTDELSPTWYKTQLEKNLSNYEDAALNEIYQNLGKYRREDIKFGKGIFAKYDKDTRQLLLDSFHDKYDMAIEEFQTGLSDIAENANINRHINFTEKLSQIIGPEYFDAVIGQFDTLLTNPFISTDTKNTLFKQLSELYMAIDRGLGGEDLDRVMALASSTDFSDITDIYNFLDQLEEWGIDLDAGKLNDVVGSDIGSHINELLEFVNANLVVAFESFSQKVTSNLKDLEKALSNASKGMDLEATTEMAQKLGVSLEAFRFEGGKFFFDDIDAIYNAYNDYNTKLREELENERVTVENLFSRKWHWTSKKSTGDKSVLDLLTESDSKRWLSDAVDDRLSYLQEIFGFDEQKAQKVLQYYDNYYDAWKTSGSELTFGQYVIKEVDDASADLAIALDGYGEYQANAFLIQNGQIEKFLESVLGRKWSRMAEDKQTALINQIQAGNFDDLPEEVQQYVPELWNYVQNSAKSFFDTALGTIDGNKQLIKADTKNKDLLTAFGTQIGDTEYYWLDLTLADLNELQDYVLKAMADGSVSQEEGRNFLKQIHDKRYQDNMYAALSGIVDTYDNFSYEAGETLAKALRGENGTVEELISSGIVSINKATGNLAIKNFEQIADWLNNQYNTGLMDTKTYNDLRAKLETHQRELSDEAIFADILENREKLNEENIASLATLLSAPYDEILTWLESNSSANGDGTYKLRLTELLHLVNQKLEIIPNTIIDTIAEQLDDITSAAIGLASANSKGFTDLASMQKYVTNLRDQGITVNGKEATLDNLFDYNESLRAYQLTAEGIIFNIVSGKAELKRLTYELAKNTNDESARRNIQEQIDVVTDFINGSVKQFADAIDISGFLAIDYGDPARKIKSNELRTAIDNYNAALFAIGEEEGLNTTKIINSLYIGGEAAVKAAEAVAEAQGKTLSADDVITAYRKQVSRYINVIDTITAKPGEIVDKTTAEIIGMSNVTQIGNSGQYVVQTAANLYEAYLKLFHKMANTGEATIADLNKIVGLAFDNKDNQQVAINALSNAASMTYSELGEIFTSANQLMTDELVENWLHNGILKDLGGGKVQIVDFTKFAALMNFDVGSPEYVSAFKTYNDSLIEMNRQAERNILEEAQSVASAHGGDWINLTQLSNELNKIHLYDDRGFELNTTKLDALSSALSDYGAFIEDGILKLEPSANIPAIMQLIAQAAQESGTLLANELAELADTLAELIKGYADLIQGAITGSLSNVQAEQLQDWATSVGVGKLNFTQTTEGLKLATDQAYELYQAISQIDALQGRIVFKGLYDSLSADKGGDFSSATATLAAVNKIDMQLADIEAEQQRILSASENYGQFEVKRLDVLKQQKQQLLEQRQLYQQISREMALANMDNPDSYNFMNQNLPDTFQGPINYWNSVGQAYGAMIDAGKTGKMGIQDFYNIVTEMSNLAIATGSEIKFMGQSIGADLDGAANLIEAGFESLSNVDGKGVQIDMGKLAANLQTGATDMGEGFDKAINQMAEAQVHMLDAMIKVLETIVAMEKLGQIDVDNNGLLSIGEIFEDDGSFTTAFDNVREYLLNSDALIPLLDDLKVNGVTLRQLLDASKKEWRKANISEQQYASIMSAFYQASISDNYDLDSLISSVMDVLAGTGQVFSYYDQETGVETVIDMNGRTYSIDWNSEEDKKNIYQAFEEAGYNPDELTDEAIRDILDQGQRGELTGQALVAYELSYGIITEYTVTDDEGKSKKVYKDNYGNTYDSAEEAVMGNAFAKQQSVGEATSGREAVIKADKVVGYTQSFTTTAGLSYNLAVDVAGKETYTTTVDGYTATGNTYQEMINDLLSQVSQAEFKQDYSELEYEDQINLQRRFNIITIPDIIFKDSSGHEFDPETNPEIKTKLGQFLNQSHSAIENALHESEEGIYTLELDGNQIDIQATNMDEAIAKLQTYFDPITTAISTAITNAFTDPKTGVSESIGTAVATALSGGTGEAQEIPIGEITVKPTTINVDTSGATVGNLDELQNLINVGQNGETTDLTANVTVTLNNGESIPLKVTGVNTDSDIWTVSGITAEGQTITLEGTEIAGLTLIGTRWKVNSIFGNGASIDLGNATITNITDNNDGTWTIGTVNGSITLTVEQVTGLTSGDAGYSLENPISAILQLLLDDTAVDTFRNEQESKPLNLKVNVEEDPHNDIFTDGEKRGRYAVSRARRGDKAFANSAELFSFDSGTDSIYPSQGVEQYVNGLRNIVQAGGQLANVDISNLEFLQNFFASGNGIASNGDPIFTSVVNDLLALNDANAADTFSQMSQLAQTFSGMELGDLPAIATALNDIVTAMTGLQGVNWETIASGLTSILGVTAPENGLFGANGTAQQQQLMSLGNTLKDAIQNITSDNVTLEANTVTSDGATVTMDSPTINAANVTVNATATNTGEDNTLTPASAPANPVTPTAPEISSVEAPNAQVEAPTATINAEGSNITGTVTVKNNNTDTGNNNSNSESSSGSPSPAVEIPAIDTSTLESSISSVESSVSTAAENINKTANAIASLPDKSKEVGDTATAISKLESKSVTFTGTVRGKIEGSIKATISADGAATATATADKSDIKTTTATKAKGNVALSKGTASGKGTLMGELGPELVVSNGRYFVVGENGAEMVDLAPDAIVFNHLQTDKLLKNKKINSYGKPVKSERTAVSFAKGTGPAMASASAALAALKQLRAMWQSLANASLKDLGGMPGGSGGGGGGGGGNDAQAVKSVTQQVERWYNWIKEIDSLQQDINKLTKEYNLLEKQGLSTQQKLSNLQDQYAKKAQSQITRSKYAEEQRKYRASEIKRVNKGLMRAFYNVGSDGRVYLANDDDRNANFAKFLVDNKGNKLANGKLTDLMISSGVIKAGTTLDYEDVYSQSDADAAAEQEYQQWLTTKKGKKASEKAKEKQKKKIQAKYDKKIGEKIKKNLTTKYDIRTGADFMNELQRKNEVGENVHNAREQWALIEAMGFDDLLPQIKAGIDTSEEGWEEQAVENFYNAIDADKESIESLTESIEEQEQAALEDAAALQEINEQIRELAQPLTGVTDSLQQWYNELKRIEAIQAEINRLQKVNSNYQADQIANGHEIYKNYKSQVDQLEKQKKINDNLLTQRKKERDATVAKYNGLPISYDKTTGTATFNDTTRKVNMTTSYTDVKTTTVNGKKYLVDTKGNYVDDKGVLRNSKGQELKNQNFGEQATTTVIQQVNFTGTLSDIIKQITSQDATGKVAYNATQQYQILKQLVPEKYLQYDESGKKLYDEFGEMTKEEQEAIVKAAIARIQGAADDINNQTSEINQLTQDNLDIQNSILEIQNTLRDNSIEVQNLMKDAVVQEHQDAIDQKTEIKDAIKDSADRTISGLRDSLEKQRKIYEGDQNQEELSNLQMQLSILQNTNGSISKIRDLQQKIKDKQKDIYFEERELAIDELEDTAQKQVEVLEEQIDLMQTALDYQVKYGLIWEEVNNKLSVGSDDSIVDYILQNTPNFLGANTEEQTKQLVEALEQVSLFRDYKRDSSLKSQISGLTKYATGGEIDYTGPAWVDGSKSQPEYIFNANQMKILQRGLSNNVNLTNSLVSSMFSMLDNLSNMDTYNSINSQNDSVVIEHAEVNVTVSEVASDYDARKIGEQALNEMVRIARKVGSRNISRR